MDSCIMFHCNLYVMYRLCDATNDRLIDCRFFTTSHVLSAVKMPKTFADK